MAGVFGPYSPAERTTYAVTALAVNGSGRTSSYTTAMHLPEIVRLTGATAERSALWAARHLFDFVSGENVNVVSGRITRGIPDDALLQRGYRCGAKCAAPPAPDRLKRDGFKLTKTATTRQAEGVRSRSVQTSFLPIAAAYRMRVSTVGLS